MSDVLISAFEPFDGAQENVSRTVLEALPPTLCGFSLAKVTLPVSYASAYPLLEAALKRHHPALLLMSGLARKRKTFTLERLAVNLDHATLADNDGVIRTHHRIVEDAPDALFTNLPFERILDAAARERVSLDLSESAGRYVCNDVFYQAMLYTQRCDASLKAGFIHLPPSEEAFESTLKRVMTLYRIIIKTTLSQGVSP